MKRSIPRQSAENPPDGHIPASVPERLLQLRTGFASRVRGQAEVLGRLVAAVLRRELGTVPALGRERCQIFAGPTGVGKTLAAISLAECAFGAGCFHRFDCGEFRSKDALSDLLGNRSGDAGRFGEAFASVPRGVWLFDEIEKAQSDFTPLLLAMADAGRLTLASGQTLDLSGIYLVATTNLGSAEILEREHLPFTSLERHVSRCLERHFRPELVARFSRPLVFRPLDAARRREIAALHLTLHLEWLRQRGIVLQADGEVLRFLIQRGFSARLGARPLVDAILELVGDAVVRSRLRGEPCCGRLVVEGNRLSIRP